MPRSNINYREQDNRKIANLVKRFNAKVARHQSKGYQPEKISVRQIKEQAASRAELNRVLNMYGRYLRPGAQTVLENNQGVKYTRWAKNEIVYANRRINAVRKKEREIAAPSTYKGTMGTIQANNLTPRKNITKTARRQKDFERFMKSTFKQANVDYIDIKAEQYKANYIAYIKENFRPSALRNTLLETIEEIDAKEMYYSFYDDPALQISFLSVPLQEDHILTLANNHWLNRE